MDARVAASRKRSAQQVAEALAQRQQDPNRIRNATFDAVMGVGAPATTARGISGLIDFLPGVGDAAGFEDAYQAGKAGDYGTAALLGAAGLVGLAPGVGDAAASGVRKGIRAFHGSPHDFDRFDISKIGTGEGVQAEGYGLYFAENPQVAQRYRDRVKDADGRLYEVSINANPEDFVDWNAPLSGQPQSVRDWFDSRGITEGFAGNQSGMELMMAERGALGDRGVAESMREAGIPGIRYLDAGSRGAGDGSRNYVVFDDSLVEIVRKYGLAGLMAMGGMGALYQPQEPEQY